MQSPAVLAGAPAMLVPLWDLGHAAVLYRLEMVFLLMLCCDRQQTQLSQLLFANVLSFSCRPTPEEALKWGDSLEKLLLHKCKCLPDSSASVCRWEVSRHVQG